MFQRRYGIYLFSMCEEEVVVIEWRGTPNRKGKFCVPRPKVIDSLAKVLREVLDHTPKPYVLYWYMVPVLRPSSQQNLETPEGKLPDGTVAPEEEDGCHSQKRRYTL